MLSFDSQFTANTALGLVARATTTALAALAAPAALAVAFRPVRLAFGDWRRGALTPRGQHLSLAHWSLVVAVVSLGCSHATQDSAPTPPEQVYAMFGRIAADSLWPGFDPSGTAVAIYDGEETWLFGHPAPPPDFRPAGARSAPARYPGRHPVVTANTSTVLAGVPTATVFVQLDVNDDPLSWAGVAIHEAFHIFQQRHHPSWRPNEVDLLSYPRDNADVLTARRLETESLRLALAAVDEEALECWAGRALSYRRLRFALLDSASARYERESERLEGLADYVELRATSSPLAVPPVGFPPEAVRARSYVSGAAMALLLDRVDPRWRERLEHDDARYLDDMLHAAVPHRACGSPETGVDEDSVRASAIVAIDSLHRRMVELREAFDNQAGWTLTILADRTPLLPTQFDPLNIDILSEREVLHRRFIRLEDEVNWLELFDRPGVTRGVAEHPLFAGVVEVTVTGLASRPTLARQQDVVSVRAPGVEGSFHDAEVTWGDRSVRIRIR